MLSRSLLARSGPLRLSATLTTRVSPRSLSTLRLAQLARCAVPSCANLRRFSDAPAFRTEDRDDARPSHPPSGKCYIANIPYKITADVLKDAFSEFGQVESVKLLTSDNGLSRGVGFVHFASVEDAVRFVEAHEADPFFVLDRQLYVEHAQQTRNTSRPAAEPSDTLMVQNVQGESEAGVRDMFGGFAGDILAVRFHKREDRPWRNVFVQFRNVNIATEAMETFKNQNENTRINYARQRQPPTTYTLTSRLSQYRAH